MKHKVGDKVRVRKDLAEDEKYGREFFVSSMRPFIGIEQEVSSIGDIGYVFIGDDHAWCFTDKMLED